MDRLERRQSSSGPCLASSPDAQPPLDLVSPGARAADGGPLLPGPLLAHSFKQHVYLSVCEVLLLVSIASVGRTYLGLGPPNPECFRNQFLCCSS